MRLPCEQNRHIVSVLLIFGTSSFAGLLCGTMARYPLRRLAMPRANSVQEVFDGMPSHFLPDQAGDLRAVIQFDLSGEGGGQWFATVADRTLNVNTGQAPAPTLTLTTSA